MRRSTMTSASPDLAARTRQLALLLTSWPSVTGSPDEAKFAFELTEFLVPLLDIVSIQAIPDDKLERCNVFAAKLGEGRRTVLLSGHFDTVPFADYGDLAPWALDPLALRERAIERLRATSENPLALADLESGNFLPGRGLLDMKAGIAAGIAAMEAYGGNRNLLLVATPDEEDRSVGMRTAIWQARRLTAEWDLDIEFAINLDAISDQGDGSLGQTIAMGSIGKQLLTALVIGKEAHACYPQDGVNAAYLAAELVTELEGAAELAEHTGAETAAAPTALHAKDAKSGYNVTTPGQAWVYWNTLQHRRSGAEVLDIAVALARRAMDRARRRLGRDIPVLTYAQLARRLTPRAASLLAETARREDLDLPERSKLATQLAWERSGLAGPAVILGFGSIPYPAVSLGDEVLEGKVLRVAREQGVGALRYFPGISDMSFVGRAGGDMAAVAANTPIAGTGFAMPEPAGYPCINIGPWGRDYHHWLERLYTPYAFGVLPQLILEVAETVLEGD